jgi:hypothetical protein
MRAEPFGPRYAAPQLEQYRAGADTGPRYATAGGPVQGAGSASVSSWNHG